MTTAQFDNAPGVIVIADDAAAAAAAQTAASHAGARVVATVSWGEARDRVGAQVAPVILLIEAIGVAADVVERVLPDLVDMAGAARIIVTFGTDRLDQVGAVLIGSEAALLCDATQADRIAALVVAAQHDALDIRDSREEAVRLALLNAEIARFTERVANLNGGGQGAQAAGERDAIVGDRHTNFDLPPTDGQHITAADLRRAIRARRLRDEVFGLPGLFEDPAWDMLLDLFAAELEQRPVSVSSLCIAAAVAPTTALRWINKLITVGLLERSPDEFDRRRAFVALTPRGSIAVRDYVAALRRGGLAIA